MEVIWHIARNTFRESVRDRTLYAIAFFAALMVVSSLAFGWVSAGDQWQIVQDFSLLTASLFGALMATFLGGRLIHQEVDRRTLYTILAKPVDRWQVVIGKYVGLAAVLLCMEIGMSLASVGASLWAAYNTPDEGFPWIWRFHGWMYMSALLLIYVEALVITALSVFFGTVTGPFLSALFTFTFYIIGQWSFTLYWMLSKFKPVGAGASQKTGEYVSSAISAAWWVLKPLTWALYYLLPDLHHFQLRDRVTREAFPIVGEITDALWYGGAYAAITLIVACIVFSRKRL